MRLQVRLARALRRVTCGPGGTEVLCEAGDRSPEGNRLILIDQGVVEASVPGAGGAPVVVGQFGPGAVLGGLRALGLTSCHVLTVRHAPADAGDGLVLFEVSGAEVAEMWASFGPELEVLRRRVLSDTRRAVMPCIVRTIRSGEFFRRYDLDLVRLWVKQMDLRIFRPGDLIFKEKRQSDAMAVLFSGTMDISVQGTLIASYSACGTTVGE
ncbi:unnamed protein product, partial [Prorocentrum cordatum]